MTIARRYVLPLLFWALIPALSAPVLAQALTAEILFPTSDRHAVLEFSPLADDTLAVRFAFRSAT
ncbi:hypothetical protein JW992_11255, partial [candidate division KSB1 bacterium]|nr:hypothetical protein [candidate division KSB1 bacterium]